jgi:ABC-type sugar transport system permease subunit
VNATKELLPSLPNGHQVIVPGNGHTTDFFEKQPEAGKYLLTTFYDTGRVDSSHYVEHPVDLTAVPLSMSTIAYLLVGITTGVSVLGLLVLGLLLRRRRRRGAPSRRASRWIRALTVVPLGLAGWFLGVLFAWSLAPSWFIASAVVAVPGAGLLIGLGAHFAASSAGSVSRGRVLDAAITVATALVGALLVSFVGSGLLIPVFAIIGAALGANLRIALRGRRRRVEVAVG